MEKQSIGNLSIAKAEELLESIGLSISVTSASPRPSVQTRDPTSWSAVERAAATASVSYGPVLTAKQLEDALLSGDAPGHIWPHIRVLPDEAPMSLLAKVVEELQSEKGVERALVWSHMRRLAHELKCFRSVWR